MNHEVLDLIDQYLRTDLGIDPSQSPSIQAANLLLRAARRYLHGMPYEEYLQTEWWAERRRDAVLSAGGRCMLCNKAGGNVHHRTYDRRGFELLSDLTYLCVDCHKRFHDLFVGGDAPPLCNLCDSAMTSEQGRDHTFWFCPSGHGPIIGKPLHRA